MVDAGDLLAPYVDLVMSEKGQRRVKAELLLEVMAKTGIDAMTVGRPDFAFGKDFLVRNAAAWGLPYVCANLADSETKALIFPPGRIVQAGEVGVGVFGLIGKGYVASGLEVTDPLEAARVTVADLRARGATLIVALANQTAPENDRLARKVDGIDIIVAGSSHRKLDPPAGDRDTLIVEPGSKGKYFGLLELYLHLGGRGFSDLGAARRLEERAERFRHRVVQVQARLKTSTRPREQRRLRRQLEVFEKAIREAETAETVDGSSHGFVNRVIPLGREIPDDPGVARLVSQALERMHAAAVAGLATSRQAGDSRRSFGDFVGAQACVTCHEREYEQWRGTRHAVAYRTLASAHRQFDYQCFGCHVTGHGQPGGPTEPLDVGYLENVQCEACHGPRRAHVAGPDAAPPGSSIDEALCRGCHSREQAGDRFDFATYLPRVDHTSVLRSGKAAGGKPRGPEETGGPSLPGGPE